MRVALAVGLTVAAAAFPTPEPEPYWQRIDGCSRGHSEQVARHKLRRLLKVERPVTPFIRGRVDHYRRCVETRRARLRNTHLWQELRRWRLAYQHVWPIRFNRLDSWLRSWAWATSSCETGGTNDPATSTGNGFYGAFQWVPSTWWAAGGDRWPTLASWHHQAVLAVRFMLRHGDEHWPVCGD
jgi:Transglycosylase-like domain